MADWTTITETATDPDAPVTSVLVKALRDNPQAIAEGASGAPRVRLPAFDRLVAGGVVKHDKTYTVSAGNIIYAVYPFIQFGTVNLSHSSFGSGSAIFTRVRGGVSVVVSTGTVSVMPGDRIHVSATGASGTFISRVQFSTNGVDIFPIGDDWSGYTSVNNAP